jgi:hypothetical protein
VYKHGAVFVLFPLKQAATVLGDEAKKYIISTLLKMAVEVPVAQLIAAQIEFTGAAVI